MTNTSVRRTSLPLSLAALLLLAGCGLFRSPAPISPETQRNRGMAAYADRNYGQAVSLLSVWVTENPGDPRLPETLMALGNSYTEREEYIAAAASFLRVVTEFPNDPQGQSARFGLCRAYFRLSPRAQLAQDYTESAIAYCESYAQIYPNTPEAAQATGWIAELRDKLGRKAYETGAFYVRRRLYDAAVVYFRAAADLYPDTPWAATSLLRMAEAYDRIGYREEAEAARARLRSEHPQSPEARALAPAAATTPAP